MSVAKRSDSLSEDAPLITANEKSSCALPLKNQAKTKKTNNKAIEFVCKELRSLDWAWLQKQWLPRKGT